MNKILCDTCPLRREYTSKKYGEPAWFLKLDHLELEIDGTKSDDHKIYHCKHGGVVLMNKTTDPDLHGTSIRCEKAEKDREDLHKFFSDIKAIYLKGVKDAREV